MRDFWFRLRRRLRHVWQWLWWSDRQLWSLDVTVAGFALPRLRRFREVNAGHPETSGRRAGRRPSGG
jgi:hypothetical protein